MRPDLYYRIAQALDWSFADVQSFSLPTLRELVRSTHPKLAYEITRVMRGPEYFLGEPLDRKVRR